jgi:hypothetical protein
MHAINIHTHVYSYSEQSAWEYVEAEQCVKYELDSFFLFLFFLFIDVVKCDMNSKSVYGEQLEGKYERVPSSFLSVFV